MRSEADMERLRLARIPKPKKVPKPIARKSAKTIKREAEEKQLRGGGDTLKEQWFKRARKILVGTCQCGCGLKSQKNDDLYFRHSCCHIFPKGIFESVMYDISNLVERAFFGGCHTNMDEGGLDKWPAMQDWPDIKEKFHALATLLTEKERATKFYTRLEKLVYAN